MSIAIGELVRGKVVIMVKNKLREIRKNRNLSQYDLAELSSVSQGQISNKGKIESGRELRESDIRKFCRALECKADYLLGLIDDEEKIKG